VQLLLDRGAVLNGEPPTAFHFACEMGAISTLEFDATHLVLATDSLSLSNA